MLYFGQFAEGQEYERVEVRESLGARSAMKLFPFVCAVVVSLGSACAMAQSCPKVAYSTPNATLKQLVAAVNCMNSANDRPSEVPSSDKGSKSGLGVETFQIIGPQHTRIYRHVVFAVLSVPVGNGIKTVAVTKEAEQASIMSTGGGECKIKVNADNSVDGQCSLTGGTMYVVHRN